MTPLSKKGDKKASKFIYYLFINLLAMLNILTNATDDNLDEDFANAFDAAPQKANS